MRSNAREGRRVLGSLRTADGRGVVRVEDRFDTDIDDLWSALTDPGRLLRWLGQIEGDLRLGGEFQAAFFDGWAGTGRVETCEPPRSLRLSMRDADPQPGQPDEGSIEITLGADGDQALLVWEERGMSGDAQPEVTALAINVTIPEPLRWTDTRRGEAFTLTTLNIRLLPDGHLAAKAYGRPTGGGRGTYVSFPVPERPELALLVADAASRAGVLWTAHRGLG